MLCAYLYCFLNIFTTKFKLPASYSSFLIPCPQCLEQSLGCSRHFTIMCWLSTLNARALRLKASLPQLLPLTWIRFKKTRSSFFSLWSLWDQVCHGIQSFHFAYFRKMRQSTHGILHNIKVCCLWALLIKPQKVPAANRFKIPSCQPQQLFH
jgi:hypothetical protein